jgi:four helix bundle protein
MSDIRSFRDLDAWQLAMTVVELTYRVTDFPDDERFGLVLRMRRAAVSVPSNVAEGQAVRSPRWSLRHLGIAIGSLAELDTHLEVTLRLRYVSTETARDFQATIERLRQILYGLRRVKERRLGLSVGTVSLLVVLALMRLAA